MDEFLQLFIDENVATDQHDARVLTGEQPQNLFHPGWKPLEHPDRDLTWHLIDTQNRPEGITVDLGSMSMINHIELMLWDGDAPASFSYYIELSLDRDDWHRVIDHSAYLCRSKQKLYFEPRDVRYIRVVGTNSTVGKVFYLVSLRAMYTTTSLKLSKGIPVPGQNVASIKRDARVVEGAARSQHDELVAGSFTNYDFESGFTSNLESGCIMLQLPQPYMIDSMRLLLPHGDERSYSYYVETSIDKKEWTRVVDRSNDSCSSWQVLTFDPLPVVFIKIVGTYSTASKAGRPLRRLLNRFDCVHFECPAQVRSLEECSDSSPSDVGAFFQCEPDQPANTESAELVSGGVIWVDIKGRIVDTTVEASWSLGMEHMAPEQYPARLILEENIAIVEYGTHVLKGEQHEELFRRTSKNRTSYYMWHSIGNADGITIDLGHVFIVNYIELLLWDRVPTPYSYYVEASVNRQDWCRIVDHSAYLCRSTQKLSIEPRGVRYIRVVGTDNATQRHTFVLESLEARCTVKACKLRQGICMPEDNVALIQRKARVVRGLGNSLINGSFIGYDGESGYTSHTIASGPIVVQLPQPFMIDSMRLLLWDGDARSYSYYVEISVNGTEWTRVADRTGELCRSWQILTFDLVPVVFVRIVGTHCTANELFRCVHFECPAQVRSLEEHSQASTPNAGHAVQLMIAGQNREFVSGNQPAAVSFDKQELRSETSMAKVLYQAFYCGELILDENVAESQRGALVLTGEQPQALLGPKPRQAHDTGGELTRHRIGDENGITVDLADVFITNQINLALWDKESRSYSYYVEVSVNRKDWCRIIDNSAYLCRATQELFFHARDVRYIRVVATQSTVEINFYLVSLEARYTVAPLRCIQGIAVPEHNIALVQRSAVVIEGVSRQPHAMIDGNSTEFPCNVESTWHRLGDGCIMVQLAQPYVIDSMRLRLWDRNLEYSYYIETSANRREWTRVADRTGRMCHSWQIVTFKPRPVVFVKIVGTRGTGNDLFQCMYFECPARVR